MNVCIFSTYFYPEDFKVNDIAFELVKLGYKVTVVTAIPNYPKGKFFKGYSLFKRRTENINGVNIIRLPVIPRGQGNAFGLVMNYLSFLISSVIYVYLYANTYKYDAIFVHQASPFTVGVPATILKIKLKIPMYFWVLDLWPESITSTGGTSNSFVLSIITKMVVWVYNNCDAILVSSKGFIKAICEKGNYADKIVYFPNWTEDVLLTAPKSINNIIILNSFTKEDFIILFTGNFGKAQNIEAVIQAAILTKANNHIKWLLVGDGRNRISLQRQIIDNSLEQTVFMPGRFPLDTMPFFISKANLLLVTLKDEYIFNQTVPAKLQTYMSSGKPILGMINGDGADIIVEANCGFAVPAGNYFALAEKVKELSFFDSAKLNLFGENGKKYYNSHFSKNQRIQQLHTILQNYERVKK